MVAAAHHVAIGAKKYLLPDFDIATGLDDTTHGDVRVIANRDISILAATLLLKHSGRKNCLEAGCTDYIVKPFSFLAPQEKIQALNPGSSPNTLITGGGKGKVLAALSRCLCIRLFISQFDPARPCDLQLPGGLRFRGGR